MLPLPLVVCSQFPKPSSSPAPDTCASLGNPGLDLTYDQDWLIWVSLELDLRKENFELCVENLQIDLLNQDNDVPVQASEIDKAVGKPNQFSRWFLNRQLIVQYIWRIDLKICIPKKAKLYKRLFWKNHFILPSVLNIYLLPTWRHDLSIYGITGKFLPFPLYISTNFQKLRISKTITNNDGRNLKAKWLYINI